MANPTDNLNNALVPVGKGNEDLVDELIDERILRILGLEDNFDIDYGTYKSLLKEQSVLISTGKSKIPREEEMLIQGEFKRIKTKVGRFTVKQKKLTVDNIKFSKSSPISLPQKQISSSADTKSPELKSSHLQDIQKALDDIIKSLIDQDKTERKNSENQRKKRETSKRAGVESGLEKGFSAVQKVAEKVIAPVKSILDKIINFFVTLLVGRAIYLLIDWIGKKENQNKLNSVIRFFSDHWPKLLALYLTFGTGLGKFVGFLSKVIIGGSRKLAQLAATLLAKAGVGKAAGVAKFLGGKNGKLLGAGLGVLAAVGTTMLAESAIKNVAGVDKPEEPKKPGYSGGGSVKIPKFAGGGLNFKGMMGGAGMGAMFGPMGMLLGGALGSGKPQEMANGFVSGEKGVDKVPAMLTDGEFVMSTGAVRKYGVDTLEGMNAAGGGTNRPKMMGGKTYAFGGGFVGDEELYRIAANNNRGENLKEISYDPNNQAHKNTYEKIKKIAIKKGVYKPSIKMNSPNIKTNVDVNYNSSPKNSMVKSPGGGLATKPLQQIRTNMNVPGGKSFGKGGIGGAIAVTLVEMFAPQIQEAVGNMYDKMGIGMGNLSDKKLKKEIEDELKNQKLNSSGPGGALMGDHVNSSSYERTQLLQNELDKRNQKKLNQGGAIKGGFGLKDQSFKDAPKTQIMTDDKGRPFVGYKSMRNGKLHYSRGPQPGTGTSNPFEAFGRAINPGAYKDNDAKLAMQNQRVAATNSLESLQARGASADTQSRMMKQIGANSKQTQNDLSYRKNEQMKYAKRVFLTPGAPTQQKQSVFFVPAKTKPKSAFTVPKSQSAPGFSASHPSGNSRNAKIYGLN